MRSDAKLGVRGAMRWVISPSASEIAFSIPRPVSFAPKILRTPMGGHGGNGQECPWSCRALAEVFASERHSPWQPTEVRASNDSSGAMNPSHAMAAQGRQCQFTAGHSGRSAATATAAS